MVDVRGGRVSAGVESKATTTNPKDLFGSRKVSISKLPFAGLVQGALAMMDGAEKYGPYNWRAKEVLASIYVDAIFRHVGDFFEGRDVTGDSFVHPLGHVIACCAIVIDAQAHGKLVDDRPGMGDVIVKLLREAEEAIKKRRSLREVEARLKIQASSSGTSTCEIGASTSPRSGRRSSSSRKNKPCTKRHRSPA